MAYSQGSVIAAADYNTLINGTNQLNTVWGVGSGNAGYGQSAISTVASSDTVTATQWATVINRLNSINGILNLVTIDSGLNIPNELIEAYVILSYLIFA